MKANHNATAKLKVNWKVVVNISSSKNESKSQPSTRNIRKQNRCCKYQ
nr:hypothetical protein [Pedobacter puniceum]